MPRLRGVPWLEPGEHVFREDLEAAEREQGVRVGPGDILLVRTGHARRLAELPPWDTTKAKVGPASHRGVLPGGAIASPRSGPTATTTPLRAPPKACDFPIHVLAINAMGIHLLDYLQFEDLVAQCEAEQRWEFLFVAAPLRIVERDGIAAQPDRDLLRRGCSISGSTVLRASGGRRRGARGRRGGTARDGRPGVRPGHALLTAEVAPESADAVLDFLVSRGVAREDIALARLDEIGPIAPGRTATSLIWADMLGQASLNARPVARYLVFMMVAGVIAAFGVIEVNSILIVGAMAVSPDVLPIAAACVAAGESPWPARVARARDARRRARERPAWLRSCSRSSSTCSICFPPDFVVGESALSGLTTVNDATIGVALAAGIAGMLALETRASSAVGVAISDNHDPGRRLSRRGRGAGGGGQGGGRPGRARGQRGLVAGRWDGDADRPAPARASGLGQPTSTSSRLWSAQAQLDRRRLPGVRAGAGEISRATACRERQGRIDVHARAEGKGEPGRERVAGSVGIHDRAAERRCLEGAGPAVICRVRPSICTPRRNGQAGRPAVRLAIVLFARVARAAHERVERHVASRQGVTRPGRRDERPRRASGPERRRVSAREVDAVHLGKTIPRQIVVPPGNQPLALHGDRALPAGVEQRHRPSLGTVTDHRLDLDPVSAQLLPRAAPMVIVAERREERRRPAELRQLHGRDRAAAGRLGPPLVRVHDLACERHAGHGKEVDPLDVPDDREPGHERRRYSDLLRLAPDLEQCLVGVHAGHPRRYSR